MNMPLGAARPSGTATVDGAPTGADGCGTSAPGADGRPGRDGGDGTGHDGTGGDADSGTDGRVDGTAREPSGPYLGGGSDEVVLGSAEWDLLTDGIRWNAETYLLLGCDPDHGPLSLDRLPDRVPEADRPLLRRMMTDALVHGRVAAGTLRIRRPGGRHHSVECAGEPVLGADGTVTALRMLLRPAPPD
ncbi:PAS domain-containing protein [Kitasatospora sp. NPDC048545]|uniref:PAS domain-containing protein n=1 Tax=Kitasatospora sp. NPDC048545 TaxID=3157208 RepID=UPI0033EFF5F7